jgi:hypothetical protein
VHENLMEAALGHFKALDSNAPYQRREYRVGIC